MRPFAGTTVKQLILLAGLIAPLAVMLGWQTWADGAISAAYANLQLGAQGANARMAFSREADCVFLIGSYTVQCFLPAGPRRTWGGQDRQCRRSASPRSIASWSELPQAYSAACVVVGSDGRVHGLTLIGEDRMRTIPGSPIGRD